jgi:predicted  nucleic acid-binding Zn-ribbon protein
MTENIPHACIRCGSKTIEVVYIGAFCRCTNCGLTGKKFSSGQYAEWRDVQLAIEWWNERPLEKESDADFLLRAQERMKDVKSGRQF